METLEASLNLLLLHKTGEVQYEVYRNAVVKGFELSLETAGKLLRKSLKSYEANPKWVDELVFKDVLRFAGKHGLLSNSAVERWFTYREHRNTTAHDCGSAFAEHTLKMLPNFISDARQLAQALKEKMEPDTEHGRS